jgi:serine/threonine protein kinase
MSSAGRPIVTRTKSPSHNTQHPFFLLSHLLSLSLSLLYSGFSTVSEITAFRPGKQESRKLHPFQELSRKYLTDHAIVHPDIPDDHNCCSDRKQNQPCPRYAIKYLRSKLVTHTPDKFKRAAIDLVLEGQLLLVLDHPSIISIRAWSGRGPESFASGDPRDFFIIIDRLPESLEDRMWAWRTKLIKYRRRYKQRSVRQRSSQKVTSWVRRRLRGEPDEEQPPPPPDKYAIKLQALLLERLQTGANVARGVAYMHSKRLIHRDLKTANIGFDVHGDVKLFDLGLSRLLPTKKAEKKNASDDPVAGETKQIAASTGCATDCYVMSRVGTKFYMAPEIRRKEPYNLSADVYSFGVILWELLSLSTPRDVYHHERDQYYQATSKGRRNPAVSSKYAALKQLLKDGGGSWLPLCPCWPVGLQTLVTSALSSDPEERPTMEEVSIILQQHVDAIMREMGEQQTPAVRRRSTLRVDLSHTNLNSNECVDGSCGPTLIGDSDQVGKSGDASSVFDVPKPMGE